MASGGTYRIESSSLNKSFQSPETTTWTEQNIAQGLNGIPINNSYKVHTWSFPSMQGCDFDDLVALFESQQDNNSQLTELETDPYDASGSIQRYGTVSYTDFFIISVDPRTRGLPLYEGVTVTFQVYVA